MKIFRRIVLWVLVTLGFTVLVVPLFLPNEPLPNLVAPKELADAESRFVEIDDIQVHYRQFGEGEPKFLLLHGFGASTFTWREVESELGTLGTVINYDRPAFGLTERPLTWSSTNPYSSAAQVKLAINLLDHFNIQQAVLIGNSAGGRVAVEIALAHPQRVQALILAAPAVGIGGGSGGWMRWLLNTPQGERSALFFIRHSLGGSSGSSMLTRAWHDSSKADSSIIEGYRRPLRIENWDRALLELTRAPRAPDPIPRLNELAGIPVLVITGATDQIVPVAISQQVHDGIPNSHFVAIEECGHLPQEECPGPFMQAVRAFVQSLPGGSSEK